MHARAACHQTSSNCVATILVHALGSRCLAASSLLARAALPTNQATPGSARQRRHIDGEAAAHRRRSSTRDRAGTARQQRRRPGCAPSMRQLIIRRAYALYLYLTTSAYSTHTLYSSACFFATVECQVSKTGEVFFLNGLANFRVLDIWFYTSGG